MMHELNLLERLGKVPGQWNWWSN